jgi:tRNA-2-methylthio-N6-dimethylallyladenosine synthase
MIGRSPWLQSVHVEAAAAPGELLDVTLVSAGPNSMAGVLSRKAAA